MALSKAQARKIAQSFAGVYEKTSYGTPTFFVGKKVFTQVGSHGRTDIMLLTQTLEERDHLIAADPDTFYITDHFKNYKGLLARIDRLDAKTFRTLLERRWLAIAPKKVVRAVDESVSSPASARPSRARGKGTQAAKSRLERG